MYAEDFSDFVFYAIENFEDMPNTINVGLGFDYSINEYYEKISKVIGYKGNFIHDMSKPVGMQQKLIDISKLKLFGWHHKSSLESGINKTYKYFLQENIPLIEISLSLLSRSTKIIPQLQKMLKLQLDKVRKAHGRLMT